ncbi:MAG: hypothetical protein WKF84_27835 [Pyrinomonadaceae bacterium]
MRNKLFFFGAIQRTILSQEGAGVSYTAPTAEGLARIASISGVSPFVANLLRDNLTLASTAAGTQTVLGVSGIPFGQVSIVTPGDSIENQYQLNIDYLRGGRGSVSLSLFARRSQRRATRLRQRQIQQHRCSAGEAFLGGLDSVLNPEVSSMSCVFLTKDLCRTLCSTIRPSTRFLISPYLT